MQQIRDRKRDIKAVEEVGRVAYSVHEAAQAASVGRSTLYVAIGVGELKSVKVGRRRLIRVADLESWLASKQAAA